MKFLLEGKIICLADLFADCAVYQINSVEKIHHMNSQPIVKVFSLKYQVFNSYS